MKRKKKKRLCGNIRSGYKRGYGGQNKDIFKKYINDDIFICALFSLSVTQASYKKMKAGYICILHVIFITTAWNKNTSPKGQKKKKTLSRTIS